MTFSSSADRSERLIAGLDAPDDLPDAGARVARLLAALSAAAVVDDAADRAAVATIVVAITHNPIPLTRSRRKNMIPQLLTAKAAAVTAALMFAGTAAAAATGALPDSAQSAVARTLSHVNVSVPDPHENAKDRSSDRAQGHGADDQTNSGDHGSAVGPDATGKAMRGLCTAWSARNATDADRGNSGNSIAFSNLRHAAHDAGMLVRDYCKDVAAPRPDAPNSAHGTSSDHAPAVSTPNSGGIGTGSQASDGANQGGVDHAAPEASQGSANADGHAVTPPATNHRNGSVLLDDASAARHAG